MLNARQTGLLIGLGTILWLVAALFIRTFPDLSDGSIRSAGVFLGFLPLAWLTVRLSVWVAKLDGSNLLAGVAVGLVTAALLDGIALTWFQPLYGTQPDQILFGSAGLLWGIGTVLLISLISSRKTQV